MAGDHSAARKIKIELEELSRNLWWSWSPEAQALWRRASLEVKAPRREALSRNPVTLVKALGAEAFEALAADPGYRALHGRTMGLLRSSARWKQPLEGFSTRSPVAYFSMEFGIHESLPVYSGGLGILAGDHVKSASDTSLPLIGVGLFYHEGYFRQELDAKGRQKVMYPRAKVDDLPLEAARSAAGKEIRIRVELPGRAVCCKVWRLRAGRTDVYLLDTDIPENSPADRKITHRLYGGSREDRIRQEVVAGIGGVRALRALGIHPGVWHLNEGHVAFLTLERIRELHEKSRLFFAEAVEAVAANTVFTTHTPVPEGNEVFDLALAEKYLAFHAEAAGIAVWEYLALGLGRDKKDKPILSMTILALRLSRFRNGVSALHGEVSREMWSHLWPGFRAEDAPITSVTNGVHTPTFVAPRFDALLGKHVGKDWRDHLDDVAWWKRASRIPERGIWEAKKELKSEMIRFVRAREDSRLARLGWSAAKREAWLEKLLDPAALTIGFARRFALYKRAALIFRDFERARRIFGSRSRPVQIIYAGKPHPEDPDGKKLFEKIAAVTRKAGFEGRVVLLENYDMEVARHLVRGVDVWLNNPQRPKEASGTSGQKVLVNGGLNVSVLDGWWCEGFSPRTGWAIGKPIRYRDPRIQDAEDAESLYRILEREVIPLYYRRDRRGIPVEWLRRVKSSMADLIPLFSSTHMVLEYARRLYLPALKHGRSLLASSARAARDLAVWKWLVSETWPLAHVRSALRGPRGSVSIELFLPGIEPSCVACRDDEGKDHDVVFSEALGLDLYRLEIKGVTAPRGASGAPALRIFPVHPDLSSPVELGLALPVVL